jgi:hypothetical protein
VIVHELSSEVVPQLRFDGLERLLQRGDLSAWSQMIDTQQELERIEGHGTSDFHSTHLPSSPLR